MDLFQKRCGVKEHINFGCGHARNEAQFTFYRCTEPEGHDKGENPTPHYDRNLDHKMFEYVEFV